jgi:hypothetical protein
MTSETSRPAKTHVRRRTGQETGQAHEETASNAIQPVEAQDKSTQTHNPGKQQDVLHQNAQELPAQSKANAEQPAGQHATGSFTGANPHREKS